MKFMGISLCAHLFDSLNCFGVVAHGVENCTFTDIRLNCKQRNLERDTV